MQIFVRTISGYVMAMNVKLAQRVHDIKTRLCCNAFLAMPEQLNLVFAGRELENHRTLAYYNLKPNATLHLASFSRELMITR